MNKQPEALRLAELLDWYYEDRGPADEKKAAAELRRLHAVNTELLEALKLALPTLQRLKFEADGSYGSNFVKTRAETARRNYEAARAAIAKATGEQA